MDDPEETYFKIRSVLRNLRSLHHISGYPIVGHPPELCRFTEIAFMHSFTTRSMWQNCFRKYFKQLNSLKCYLDFFVNACDSIAKSDINVFECLFSILGLTANIEVFFHNRGYEFMEYSEGIVESIFKRDLCKAFKDSGEVLGLNEYVKSSGYPKTLCGVVRNEKGDYVVRETEFKMYCEKLYSIIPNLKFYVNIAKGSCELRQQTV